MRGSIRAGAVFAMVLTVFEPRAFDGAVPESQGRVVVRGDEVYAALQSDQGVRLERRRRSGGQWGAPEVIRAAGPRLVAMSPAFDASGNRLYFESNLREPAVAGREDSDIWVIDRVDGAWGQPRPLGAPFDSPFNEHAPTVAGDLICFNSARTAAGGLGGNDIYCGALQGQPSLVTAVSSPSQDAGPWLVGNGDTLLFTSNRPGGHGGWDLYVAVRSGQVWGPPRNLGAPINTAGDELWPSWSDGRLYFKRTGAGGPGYFVMEFPTPR